MRVIEIIEAKRWRNVKTGQTASPYGSVPWGSSLQKPEWVLETIGWTWRLDNGTIGLGRIPVKTFSEAVAIAEKINNRA